MTDAQSERVDGRTETDYLEARTLKYVVVIEALTGLTTHVDTIIATTVLDRRQNQRRQVPGDDHGKHDVDPGQQLAPSQPPAIQP